MPLKEVIRTDENLFHAAFRKDLRESMIRALAILSCFAGQLQNLGLAWTTRTKTRYIEDSIAPDPIRSSDMVAAENPRRNGRRQQVRPGRLQCYQIRRLVTLLFPADYADFHGLKKQTGMILCTLLRGVREAFSIFPTISQSITDQYSF